ncbi:hypothetical protein FGB62_8g320 [Gracilaria domingensis]|nr:hypothetical protein FGB62_8g320 [Gracilaria domingensis]
MKGLKKTQSLRGNERRKCALRGKTRLCSGVTQHMVGVLQQRGVQLALLHGGDHVETGLTHAVRGEDLKGERRGDGGGDPRLGANVAGERVALQDALVDGGQDEREGVVQKEVRRERRRGGLHGGGQRRGGGERVRSVGERANSRQGARSEGLPKRRRGARRTHDEKAAEQREQRHGGCGRPTRRGLDAMPGSGGGGGGGACISQSGRARTGAEGDRRARGARQRGGFGGGGARALVSARARRARRRRAVSAASGRRGLARDCRRRAEHASRSQARAGHLQAAPRRCALLRSLPGGARGRGLTRAVGFRRAPPRQAAALGT